MRNQSDVTFLIKTNLIKFSGSNRTFGPKRTESESEQTRSQQKIPDLRRRLEHLGDRQRRGNLQISV